ncbi:MAG: N-acetyltransferase GCN5 [Stygiobacter sp.]|nr:MAG: N-acetyltransferase GCN5 [Stygiobacter sp.]KAF0217696.1 MAG: N-acetyltransferase [Ignavibacteria bacterium]
MHIKRTTGSDKDFLELVKLLNEDLRKRYPKTRHLYERGNIIPDDAHTILVYADDVAAGCGCLRDFDSDGAVELKRMFVRDEYRGKRIGRIIVEELEKWAAELNKKTIYLETGVNQPEAIFLYERMHYQWIDNYGEYAGNKESICMKKNL